MHTIVPGKGVGECCIGADKQTAIDLFGTPASETEDDELEPSQSLSFPNAGVEVNLDDDGLISALFFYFRSESHSNFDGKTDLGIDVNSSPDDVIAKYGRPKYRTETSQELDLSYPAVGVSFSFVDDFLVDVRVSERRIDTWPEEWPERTWTSDFNWIAFGDSGGTWVKPVIHAQASFLEFARIAELERFRILPTFEAVSIKAFFETIPGNPMFGEHIYLTDVYTDGKSITAMLNASAMRRDDLVEGQEVTFSIEKLSDWFLVRNGKGIGGFAIASVFEQLSDDEKVQVEQSPPFSWFAHRGSKTAEDELIAIPQCLKCNRRNLMMEGSYKEGICAIRRQGGRRCECPNCGARH